MPSKLRAPRGTISYNVLASIGPGPGDSMWNETGVNMAVTTRLTLETVNFSNREEAHAFIDQIKQWPREEFRCRLTLFWRVREAHLQRVDENVAVHQSLALETTLRSGMTFSTPQPQSRTAPPSVLAAALKSRHTRRIRPPETRTPALSQTPSSYRSP